MKWIKVEDELPTDSHDICLYVDYREGEGGIIHWGYYDSLGFFVYEHASYSTDVTHWMSIEVPRR